MADKGPSGLSAGSAPDGSEIAHFIQGGNSRKLTIDDILAVAHAHAIADVTGLQAALDAKIDDSQAGAGGLSVLGAANASAVRTAAGVVIGTDVQAFDQQLSDIAGLSYASNALKVVRVNAGETSFELATPAGTTFATAAEYRTGTEAAKALAPDQVWAAAATVALTPGTNVAVDLNSGINFTLAMGGNYTLSSPTNEKVGQTGFIRIAQDGTGSRTLAYGSEWKFAGGTDPTLSTAASAVDVLFYQVLASGEIYANLVKAIA